MRSAEEVRAAELAQVAEIRQAMTHPLQAVLFHWDEPPVESPALVDLRPKPEPNLWERLMGARS
jgi:hypothetical protein